MSAGSLARRYAKALMELGTEDGSYQRLGKELETMAKAIKNSKELSDLLANPVVPRSDREKIILAILQRTAASKTTTNTCKLLLDRERLSILPDISRELNAMIDQKSDQVTAEVTSAVALTPAQTNELRAALEELSGKKIQIQAKEDPALLGGVIAKVGDLVYDGSLRTQLRDLRRNMAAQ